ncbi:hypothetical protein MRB53_032451 [Persea americana]|uniref:Uncharacterized protein n=1 Tax=Persea americana TaxID=3435 RepID=A0ACC2KRU0_PERAE|nr:hypothetical protein MRB53_032451 [Persea americana]
MFIRAGRIRNLFIPLDKSSSVNRGFAFVRFGSQREADKAMDLVNDDLRSLSCSLVGYLKCKEDAVKPASDWFVKDCRVMPRSITLLDDGVVWIQLSSLAEVVEIDDRTVAKEELRFGRVKIQRRGKPEEDDVLRKYTIAKSVSPASTFEEQIWDPSKVVPPVGFEEGLGPSPTYGLEDGTLWGVNPKETSRPALDKFLGISNPFLLCPVNKVRADQEQPGEQSPSWSSAIGEEDSSFLSTLRSAARVQPTNWSASPRKLFIISSGANTIEDGDFATPDPCAKGGCCSVETPSASSQGNMLVVESVGGFQARPRFKEMLPGMQEELLPEAGDLLVSPASAWVSTRRPSSFLVSTFASVPQFVQSSTSRSGDRVSISTTVDGTPVRSPPTDFVRAKLFPEEGRMAEWKLSKRISDCERVVGISFQGNRGSWSKLVDFAIARDNQNRAEFLEIKRKKKGERELQSLVSFVNYDKGRIISSSVEVLGKKMMWGIKLKFANEGNLLECQRGWGEGEIKRKKKGERELQSLVSFVNYDKGRIISSSVEVLGKKMMWGIKLKFANEGNLLECQRGWGEGEKASSEK